MFVYGNVYSKSAAKLFPAGSGSEPGDILHTSLRIMAKIPTAICGTLWPSRYLHCTKPQIQTYRTNQWSNKVWTTLFFFCYSSVRRWWPTSLCFYSWSSQWVAPSSAPPDLVPPVCLNALESPLKVLQVIWDACGGKYEYCFLLVRGVAVLHQRMPL